MNNAGTSRLLSALILLSSRLFLNNHDYWLNRLIAQAYLVLEVSVKFGSPMHVAVLVAS